MEIPAPLIVNTLEHETNQIYTVQEQIDEEETEEAMKAPETIEAMDPKQESATACESLSLTPKKAIVNGKTHPYHQTMDLSNREKS
jgi:hypothetical protein